MLPASLANDLFHLHLAAVPLQRFQRLEWSGCAFGIAGGWSGSRCGWGRGGGGFANGFQGFRLFYRIGACRDRRVLRFLNLRWFLRRGRIVIYMESRALEHDGNRLHDSLDSAIGATEAFVQRILGKLGIRFAQHLKCIAAPEPKSTCDQPSLFRIVCFLPNMLWSFRTELIRIRSMKPSAGPSASRGIPPWMVTMPYAAPKSQ